MDKILHVLKKLPGITEADAIALKAAGFDTLRKVLDAKDADLKKVDGITQSKVNGFKAHKVKLLDKLPKSK